MEEYYPILLKSGLFEGIRQNRYSEALKCLHARVIDYARSAKVVEIGEPCRNTGIVLKGTLEEFMYDEDGNQVNICRFEEGQIFGAELACGDWGTSPVCLQTPTGCTLLLLDLKKLLNPEDLNCPCRMRVTANLMQNMAKQLLFFNTKIRILAQKRLRDRLKIYLQTLTPDKNGCYNLPYKRSELADFLCVDRSALSRELCRMRDEGLLSFSGTKLHLKDAI